MLTHAHGPAVALAQSGDLLPRIAGPLGFIVGVAVVGGVVILFIRRRLKAADGPNDFTLDGLERLRAEGGLTDEEFRQARQVLIRQIQDANRDPDDLGRSP